LKGTGLALHQHAHEATATSVVRDQKILLRLI